MHVKEEEQQYHQPVSVPIPYLSPSPLPACSCPHPCPHPYSHAVPNPPRRAGYGRAAATLSCKWPPWAALGARADALLGTPELAVGGWGHWGGGTGDGSSRGCCSRQGIKGKRTEEEVTHRDKSGHTRAWPPCHVSSHRDGWMDPAGRGAQQDPPEGFLRPSSSVLLRPQPLTGWWAGEHDTPCT